MPRRHISNDTPAVHPKIEIVLYTSAASEKSQKALRVIQSVPDMYVSGQVKFSTCDLSQSPQDGEADQQDILKDLLDASGVDRRRWDG